MSQHTLGIVISECRRRHGITQQELAKELSVTAAAVSKWERDQSLPDVYTLAKLADLFGMTLDELMGKNSGQFMVSPPARKHWVSNLAFFLWAIAGAEALSIVLLAIKGINGVYWAMGAPNLALKVGIVLIAEMIALFLLVKQRLW